MSINWNKGSWRTSQIFISSYSRLINCLSPREGDSFRRTTVSHEESTCPFEWFQKEILKDSNIYSFFFSFFLQYSLSGTKKFFYATLSDSERHD